ncbi:MAG: LysR family transcriptional regulator [Oscillospiraceae bacterium]|jgi:molybdate transport system regulatory protein|nr:LysR family transcriptional regulator [Oscillospiraceae bacterium]MDR2360323.1 LysR family transcriptional regulator [Oscillospiraceae bacterium]
MRGKVKVWLSNDDVGFFGPGALKLLKFMDEKASLKAACAEMNLSYSKGWKIIRNIELGLNCAILTRQQGGRYGGGCSLTNAGRELTRKYEELSKRINEVTQEIYKEIFGED